MIENLNSLLDEIKITLKARDKNIVSFLKCEATSHKKAATIDSFSKLPENDYNMLMKSVAINGPVAISVAASEWSFYYSI